MELPIPSHLHEVFVPDGEQNTEQQVTGHIRCTCGCEHFQVQESGGRQRVRLICTQCGREILLFDAAKHGWDGFVCGIVPPAENAPFAVHRCRACGGASFAVQVRIESAGKHDFLEFLAHGGSCGCSFEPREWVDAFGWIRASLRCANCGRSEKSWLDEETS